MSQTRWASLRSTRYNLGVDDLLGTLERYYDTVPRADASAEEVGPFTVFLRRSSADWPYYARPRLGHAGPFALEAVHRVRERQREVGAPEALEWVHETTPELTPAVRAAGLAVEEHPLMVLDRLVAAPPPQGCTLRMLGPADEAIREVQAAIDAGFGGVDRVNQDRRLGREPERLAAGTWRLVGAWDEVGAVGGGSHSPRGEVTELMGIAVLPRARRRGIGAAITASLVSDAQDVGVTTVFLSAGSQEVADVYARVGFRRIGTACVAEAAR